MRFPAWTAPVIRGLSGLQIKTANLGDRNFIFGCSELYSGTQGWIPDVAVDQFVLEGRALVSWFEGERIGYTFTSGGRAAIPILRHNTVLEGYRDRGLGTVQTIAAMLWADAVGRYDRYRIRTRSDIERQLKINSMLGGKVIDVGRHVATKVGKNILVFEVFLPAFCRRFAAGEFSR